MQLFRFYLPPHDWERPRALRASRTTLQSQQTEQGSSPLLAAVGN
jgi:hypothetical protein